MVFACTPSPYGGHPARRSDRRRSMPGSLLRPARLLRGLMAGMSMAFAAIVTHAASFTVAVVPQFTALDIARTWGPALERLSAQTGHQFRLLPQSSIPAFENSFRQGQPDFVFLNPYHMVMARKAQGYEPLLRDASQPLSGVLVVAVDSTVERPEQLAGKPVAFPAPNALGASLMVRAHLAQAGVEVDARYVKTHRNAYRHVLAGQAAAAGGVMQTLSAEPEDVRQRLRVIHETPRTAPHPFAAHPRVPVAVRQAVRDAVLGWAASSVDVALIAGIGIPVPVPADYRRDYEPLERLGLERFVVVEQP